MSCKNTGYRNYMDEMLNILEEIDCLKPEPEVCNIRCPPLGCPRGPCPGICCYQGICDPCAVSRMPSCPPNPHPPACRPPPLCALRAYAKAVGYPPESCLSPQNRCNQPKSCSLPKQSLCCNTSTPTCIAPCCPITTFHCF